jgi:hypothetical protein
MSSMMSAMDFAGRLAGSSAVMPVEARKYSEQRAVEAVEDVKCDLSGKRSPLRVPRPSICSNRMRDFTGAGRR